MKIMFLCHEYGHPQRKELIKYILLIFLVTYSKVSFTALKVKDNCGINLEILELTFCYLSLFFERKIQ